MCEIMKSLYILLLGISFIACDSKSNIVWENRENIVDVSSLINSLSIDTIQLETDTSCLIGRILQLKITEEGIFILNDNPNVLYRFSIEGHFIRKIGMQGRGEGEYLAIGSFDIKQAMQEIVIFDTEECCFKYYNFDGIYLRTVRNKYAPYGDMVSLNDSICALENYFQTSDIPNNPEILILNNRGEIINTYFNRIAMIDKKSILPADGSSIYWSKIGKHHYYIPKGTDELYELNEHGNNIKVSSLNIVSKMFPLDITNEEYKKQKHLKYGPIESLVVTENGMFYASVNYNDRPLEFIGIIKEGIKIAGRFVFTDNTFPCCTPLTSYKNYFVGIERNVDEYDANPIIVYFKFAI